MTSKYHQPGFKPNFCGVKTNFLHCDYGLDVWGQETRVTIFSGKKNVEASLFSSVSGLPSCWGLGMCLLDLESQAGWIGGSGIESQRDLRACMCAETFQQVFGVSQAVWQ